MCPICNRERWTTGSDKGKCVRSELECYRIGYECATAENARLETERAGWQESAEGYCDHAGRRFKLLERIHAACGRAISGDHDKKSMLATLKLCAELAASK